MIVLSAVFALGVGIAATTAASAAVVGNGLSQAAPAATLIEQAAYGCRRVTVCHRRYGRKVCRVERVCRRW
jgi:hypothetical protein